MIELTSHTFSVEDYSYKTLVLGKIVLTQEVSSSKSDIRVQNNKDKAKNEKRWHELLKYDYHMIIFRCVLVK